MDRDAFNRLFMGFAAQAIEEARTATSKQLPDQFVVELHGAGKPGVVMDPNEALNLMYIDENRFYQYIDIGVKAIKDNATVLFVRISAYPPTEFEKTWNTPKGSGPFRIIGPATTL